MKSIGSRLEEYTIKRPQEVLLVAVKIDGDRDRIAIFKGYSSSLMRPTAFDSEVPVLPEGAIVLSIDRLVSPYDPDNPQYIQQDLTWEMMLSLLEEIGV
ncbi:MAG: hypothetical protein WBB29_03085 [Geitlerinemataceae cyanobacterium]